MHTGLPELGTELFAFAFYGLLTSALAYGGMRSELSAFQHFGAGDLGIAFWYLVLGGVALYAVATLFSDRLWPVVRRVAME